MAYDDHQLPERRFIYPLDGFMLQDIILLGLLGVSCSRLLPDGSEQVIAIMPGFSGAPVVIFHFSSIDFEHS